MRTMLTAEQPDYVVINGDLVTGEDTFRENSTMLVDIIVQSLNDAKVPFSTTQGNHDNQVNITHIEEIMRETSISPLSYTRSAPPGVGGVGGPGNYWVPVYQKATDVSPVLVLWFFDSRGNDSPFWDALNTYVKNLRVVVSGHDHGDEWCKREPTHDVIFCFGKHSGYGGYSSTGWGHGVRSFVFPSSEPTDGIVSYVLLENGTPRDVVILDSEYD
ncbi:hypothetical protein ID866_11757 [Astraeus odoratus]|nr:hypothetical protein ID866_11757 [Astraeus odoratus]